MSAVFKRYHPVISSANLSRGQGQSFDNQDRAYYETRAWKREQDLAPDDENPARYQGRLRIESKVLVVGSTQGLAGETISWECTTCPHDPDIVHAKVMHRSQVGLLEGDVYCRITQSYRNLPQNPRR